MNPLSVSVVIPAYTMDRWPLIRKAVESVRRQTVQPESIVLVIDNCPPLLATARSTWGHGLGENVHILENPYDEHLSQLTTHRRAHGTARRFGAGSARNAAVETISADIVAFLDDDAWAEPEWLAELLNVYNTTQAVAVAGTPQPDFESFRPAWFPPAFDWVFGCAYEGLPKEVAPLKRMIGANMSVRRDAFLDVGGFQSVDFDDLDLCMRLLACYGSQAVYYAPRAVVHHFVPSERVSWRYFYRRCYFVNKEKVLAFRDLGTAANLSAERDFVWQLLGQISRALKDGIAGRAGAFRSVAAMVAGVALAGAGHLHGRFEALRRHRRTTR